MKQLLKKIPLTLMTIYMCLGLLFLTSCDKNKNKSDDCNGDPKANYFVLTLVDKNDSLLIGQKYNADSIRLYLNDSTMHIYVECGVIFLNYTLWQKFNNKNYILYLSHSDQDTLNFLVKNVNTPCGTILNVDTIYYNNKAIAPSNGILNFKIIK